METFEELKDNILKTHQLQLLSIGEAVRESDLYSRPPDKESYPREWRPVQSAHIGRIIVNQDPQCIIYARTLSSGNPKPIRTDRVKPIINPSVIDSAAPGSVKLFLPNSDITLVYSIPDHPLIKEMHDRSSQTPGIPRLDVVWKSGNASRYVGLPFEFNQRADNTGGDESPAYIQFNRVNYKSEQTRLPFRKVKNKDNQCHPCENNHKPINESPCFECYEDTRNGNRSELVKRI